MAYQTVRELLAHVRSVHRRLRAMIQDARPHMDGERSQLLLVVVDEHEGALERAVESVEKRGLGSVLDTWLQFQPDAEIDRALSLAVSDLPLSTGDIVALVLETENSLSRLYQLLEGSTGSRRVQAFFGSLSDVEDSAVRRTARIRLESNDV